MDETQIKFGDQVFLYGTYLQFLPEDADFYYATVTGHLTPTELSGFVVDFLSIDSFACGTAFSNLVDVTESLSRQEPTPSGTKVWMPIPSLGERSEYGPIRTYNTDTP